MLGTDVRQRSGKRTGVGGEADGPVTQGGDDRGRSQFWSVLDGPRRAAAGFRSGDAFDQRTGL